MRDFTSLRFFGNGMVMVYDGAMASPEQHSDQAFTNTPNLLTLFRMHCVPVVVGLLFIHDPFWDFVAAWLFAVASITDFLDGYIARRQNLVTDYGKLMDPLA